MSDRRKKAESTRKFVAYAAAIIVHATIIGALVFNFTSKPKTIVAHNADKIDVVKATTIDESQIKKQQDKIKQKDRDKKRKEQKERDRLKKLKRDAQLEKKKIADLKQQRKEIALKKQQEEAKRLKEKKDRAKKLADKKKKEAAEQKRLEELARLEKEQEAAAAQDSLNKLLQEEEAANDARLAKERTTTLVQKHFALIGNKIGDVRTVDPSFETWRTSVVDIKVSPSGVVESVRTIESSGDARYDASVEAAVYKASPLPLPDPNIEPEANKQLREIEFEVKHPSRK